MIHFRKILFFIVLVLGITISVIGFMLLSVPMALEAGSSDNVSGWAWAGVPQTDGVEKLGFGWISFNGDNVAGGADYGVNIEPDGNLTGYAYYYMDDGGNEVGWIDFDPSGAPGDSAKVNLDTGEVSGWARALGYGGGWDGWISMRGTSPDYGVYIDTSTGEFHGWAWGGDVMGWISFNCENQGSCGDNGDYHVETSFSFSNPPQVTNFRKVDEPDYCLNTPIQRLEWDYTGDNPQGAYKIKFQGSASAEVERVSSSNTSRIVITSSPDINQLEVGYNESYQLSVAVKDTNDLWSGWSNEITFNSTDHPWPDISFTHEPEEIRADEVITFTDTSTVYDSTKASIYWQFKQGTPNTAYGAVATTTFSAGEDREVTLRVTDSSGFFCDLTKFFDVNFPLPIWIED